MMSAEMMMMVADPTTLMTSPGCRLGSGFAQTSMTGNSGNGFFGRFIDAPEDLPVRRNRPRLDISGTGKLPASTSTLGFGSCWQNGDCFRSHDSVTATEERAAQPPTAIDCSNLERLGLLDIANSGGGSSSNRRYPTAACEMHHDVRQVAVSSSIASRADVMTDSSYFSSSLSSSSSVSSSSSSSSADGSAPGMHGFFVDGSSPDQSSATSGVSHAASGSVSGGAMNGWYETTTAVNGGSSPPVNQLPNRHHQEQQVDDDDTMSVQHPGTSTGGGPSSVRQSANMTECVPVPSSEHVAEIVGRQGCKIKALRNKTNTYIKTPTRGEEPVFVITGRREDVATARREILSAADHFSQIRASRRAGGAGTAPGQCSSLTTSISTGGTSPGLPSQPLPPSPMSASSPLSGSPTSGMPSALSPSKATIDHGVVRYGGCGETNVSGPGAGHVTCEVRVPVRVVGLVVGPKGATIKRIQAETGTYIVTPSRGTDPVFEVVGSPDNVERARREIESYVIGNGGAVRGGGSTTTGNGAMTAGSSTRSTLQSLTEPRRLTNVGSVAADWRQLFSERSPVDFPDRMSPTRTPGVANGRHMDFVSGGLLNFGARHRLDDANGYSPSDSLAGISSAGKHSGFGSTAGLVDDFGAQLLLLHAAAEAAAANGLQHNQHQQPLPLFSTNDHRESTTDVFCTAEQLLGAGSVSGCPPSPFEHLQQSPNWSQAVRGQLMPMSPDGGKSFDMWSTNDYSTSMSAQSTSMLVKQRSLTGLHQSVGEPGAAFATPSSNAFRQHMGLLPSEVEGTSSTLSASGLPWLYAASNAATRIARGDDVIANRNWLETKSSCPESAMPGSPMTHGNFPSTACLILLRDSSTRAAPALAAVTDTHCMQLLSPSTIQMYRISVQLIQQPTNT